ncbi:ISSfl3 OrfC [Escherichia coli]|nr:ISSfl3 OrfC [Escherichia coli]SQM26939.1 ISSfl3 OrfC [Escherichia coli]
MRSAAGLIDKDQPGPGLLAQVVIAKVPDHLTLQRQQKIYARKWVPLLESTLTDGGGQMAPLWRDLLSQPVLQADETPLQIPDTRNGKLCV